MKCTVFLLGLVVLVLAGWTIVFLGKSTKSSSLPILYVRGNQVLRKDTNTQVTLRGVVSDYFRYAGLVIDDKIARAEGIAGEIRRSTKLKTYGANLIGFFLSDLQEIKKNIAELDAYLAYAQQNGLYVYLMPVARDFEGTGSDGKLNGTFDDLSQLIEFLASRYKDYSNVLYGFGAEPELTDENFTTWNTKQQRLANIVRHYNPQALLLVSSVPGPTGLDSYIAVPFPFDNVIYYGGGYTSQDDNGVRRHPEVVEQRIRSIIDQLHDDRYPVLVGEFGGNYGDDFSSDTDLAIIETIIEGMCKRNRSFTAYKLSAFWENDSLSMFDASGNVTRRGNMFINALRQCPGTVQTR